MLLYKYGHLFRIHNNSFDNSVKYHGFMNTEGNPESKCYLCRAGIDRG